MLLLVNLLLRADYRTGREGLVAGRSLSSLARELDLARNTLRSHLQVLLALGLVEEIGTALNREHLESTGWRIPPDVYAWLRDGEPVPHALLAMPLPVGLLSRDRELHQTLASAWSTASQEAEPDHPAADQPLTGTRSTADHPPAQALTSSRPIVDQADGLSPEEAPSLEVEEVEEGVENHPQTGGGVDGDEYDDDYDAMCHAAAIADALDLETRLEPKDRSRLTARMRRVSTDHRLSVTQLATARRPPVTVHEPMALLLSRIDDAQERLRDVHASGTGKASW